MNITLLDVLTGSFAFLALALTIIAVRIRNRSGQRGNPYPTSQP